MHQLVCTKIFLLSSGVDSFSDLKTQLVGLVFLYSSPSPALPLVLSLGTRHTGPHRSGVEIFVRTAAATSSAVIRHSLGS